MPSPIRPPRPRLTGPIFAYAVFFPVVEFITSGIGASWFAAGKGAVLASFPTSTAEAVACTAGGIVVTIWAVARIQRGIFKQAPKMQA